MLDGRCGTENTVNRLLLAFGLKIYTSILISKNGVIFGTENHPDK